MKLLYLHLVMPPPGVHNILSKGISDDSSSPIRTTKPVVNLRWTDVEQLYTSIGSLKLKS